MAARRTARSERPVMLGYVRVSTAKQADSGLSIAAQKKALRAEAERRGWDLEIVTDEGSGSRINGGLRSALDQLAGGQADGLIVTKIDRLARSTQHLADVLAQARKQRWNLVILDFGLDLATPQGLLMATVIGAIAEFERGMISVRTKEAMSAGKQRGATYGRPRSTPDAVVRRIVKARNAGESFGAIARTLTERGVLSPSGRPTWQESTVRRIYASASTPSPAAPSGTPTPRKAAS